MKINYLEKNRKMHKGKKKTHPTLHRIKIIEMSKPEMCNKNSACLKTEFVFLCISTICICKLLLPRDLLFY